MTPTNTSHQQAKASMPTTPAFTSVEGGEGTKPATKQLNGAKVFFECLRKEGVDTIFGLPGGVILPIYEALPDYPDIRHILVRHEQCAAHMAEGYARTAQKPGVCLATSGPAATNLITGLTDAFYDSVPVVAFTGNVPTFMLGNDAFQEADIVSMTRACTKHNVLVRTIEELPQAIHEAFHVATTGRPGPVLVDIPKDVMNAMMDYSPESAKSINLPGYQCTEQTNVSDEKIDEIVALLQSAKQPVILSGGGVVNGDAHSEMTQLAERLNIPVACSLMGLSGFPANHKLYMGFCGMHGEYWANIAIANADVLVVAGNRLNERQTGNSDRFAKNAKIIHIDLDPCNLQKNVNARLPVQGEIKKVLTQILAKLDDNKTLAGFDESLATRNDWFDKIEGWKTRRKRYPYPTDKLVPQQVIEQLFAHMPEDGYVTTEVGQHQMWAAQKFNLTNPHSFISSGGLGTMGFGFPAAIGIQTAFPDKTVLDIAGDGSFQMTLQEMITAKVYNLPVKVAVINNSRLGMIRQWQGKMFNRESEAEMISPDYVKLAEAYGWKGFVVSHPSEMDAVIKEAFAIQDCPVIIDFRVEPNADVYPWVPAGGANEDMLEEEAPSSSQTMQQAE
ncbi:MAG: biosynthetic-type acetolactate synthase large subunit [Vampirovibrio sp.]|nr:biosynthetic-type acetolactate synthase large subunit [Vampirovibrio sp.]